MEHAQPSKAVGQSFQPWRISNALPSTSLSAPVNTAGNILISGSKMTFAPMETGCERIHSFIEDLESNRIEFIQIRRTENVTQ